jgi:undecaprenyl-diphosphatase
VIIFEWEKSVIEVARTWPTSGPIFDFFRFWTDYHQSRWLLLLFLITLSIKIGWRKLIIPSMLAFISFVLADLTSRRILKAYIMRPRPNFVDVTCVGSHCWGFVSSHSTNITAAALVLCLYDRRNTYWALPVVALVCFSRIYLIDHFPLDVLGGMALGSLVGSVVWFSFKTSVCQSVVLKINKRLGI